VTVHHPLVDKAGFGALRAGLGSKMTSLPKDFLNAQGP
jgi:hypothetical protein